MKVIPPLALLFSLAALAISLIRQPEPSSEKTSLSTDRLNPLSPPCMTPNPGFHDPSAKSKSLATAFVADPDL